LRLGLHFVREFVRAIKNGCRENVLCPKFNNLWKLDFSGVDYR